MLFVSAGNSALDTDRNGFPDSLSVSDPATAKNAMVVGATDTANDGGLDTTKRRASFSSIGPATLTSGRTAPVIMAPGQDIGTLGPLSEYSCRTNDNDQNNPVECDVMLGVAGTSFASPAAAGAALLVRDYFVQGFYPDGTASNTLNAADQVPNISGALVKAILIASADFLNYPCYLGDPSCTISTANPTKYRFNNEQGYGRVQLNNILPLLTYPSPVGLIVADGGMVGGVNNTSFSGTAGAGTTETYTFTISDTTKELRVGLAWIEDASDALANDLDLELVSPSGKIYWGNYFTDDNDRDRQSDVGEDCAVAPWEALATADFYPWSLPTCANSMRDTKNPTEAIFLSPHPDYTVGAGSTLPDPDPKNQLEAGSWTLKVIGRTVPAGSQKYAVAIAGPVQLGSSVRLNVYRAISGTDVLVGDLPACNDKVKVVVNEYADVTDPTPTTSQVSARTVVQVLDSVGSVMDQETNLAFTQDAGTLKYSSSMVILTDSMLPVSGNGVLDVRDGQTIKVFYNDQTSGSADPNKTRFNQTTVYCRSTILFGGVTFGLFGKDMAVAINGGCERDARGMFTFGYPDQYMDHGELIDFQIAVQTADTTDLEDAVATLKAVYHDLDSPASCLPNTTGCTDPNRTNNVPVASSILTVLDSPKIIGLIPAQYSPNVNQTSAPVFAVNFTIQMGAVITGKLDVDMILGISARKAGKPIEGLSVYRMDLNANETALYYSTDFPTGGTQNYDWNNNESLENPSSMLGDVNVQWDYHFETVTWSDLTAGGTRNTSLQSPWKFDTNNGGFRSGLNSGTNAATSGVLAQWGEDKNFNDILDTGEDRDPSNSLLDQNWSTKGGCGWQTKALTTSATGGVWHTGRIDVTTLSQCAKSGSISSQCQTYETYPGITAQSYWWELLETPVINKVNPTVDAEGRPVYRVQFTNWAWNMAIDMPDSLAMITWEFDTDLDKISPITLEADGNLFNSLSGAFGTVSMGNAPLTNGFPVFADFNGTGATTSKNGTIGGNHEGKNPCTFEEYGSRYTPYGFALPVDDDLRNGWCEAANVADRTWNKQTSCTTADQATVCLAPTYHGLCVFDAGSSTDLYVYKNGPLRNMNLEHVNGWIDGRYYTLEDIYGDSGSRFQGAVGFVAFEGTTSLAPKNGYGVAIDDMVVEWKETRTDEDTTTNCSTAGACATLNLSAGTFYSGLAVLEITVTDRSPGNLLGVNDCDHNGLYTDLGVDDNDCDNNGTPDVPLQAYNDVEPLGEWVVLNQTSVTGVFKGNLPISSAFDSAGTLFVQKQGTSPASVTVKYLDPNDGTGQPCKASPDAAQWGQVQAYASVYVPFLNVTVKSSRVVSLTGDGDGFADTNETAQLWITISNKSTVDLTNIVARLVSNDPKVDCILQPTITMASLAKLTTQEIGTPFVFHVSSTASRPAGGENSEFTAKFSVTIASDQMDATSAAQEITKEFDLDMTGGGTALNYVEGFEGGFGTFTSMSLDKGLNTNLLSDGMRCQYSDPDYINSNSYGEKYCYLGFAGKTDEFNIFDWHIHSTASPDGGRAFLGSNSLHYGFHQSASADNDITHFSSMDAIRINNPVNLGYTPVTPGDPEMSFKMQVSMMDYRSVNALFMQAPDRAVVELQFADTAGTPTGVWQKLYPFENTYDIQTSNNYINCIFDPSDDGNNEDSYFSPTDPLRWLGPSTTCYPEFNFGSVGSTNWNNGFIPGTTERASDDRIGLQGSIDRGTWVQTKFNFDRYLGRSVRLRFLATTIKVNDTTDCIALGFPNKRSLDDGWWIDDLRISNTMSSPATISADTKDNSALAACPANCTTVTAALVSSPSTALAAPGQVVELRAAGSSADICLSGTLQYQFWLDNNSNGTLSTVDGDTLARDWSDNSAYIDAPLYSTQYGVKVRCSSAPTCASQAVRAVVVTCPGTVQTFFCPTIYVNKLNLTGTVEPDNTVWVAGLTAATPVDVIAGNLTALRTAKTYTGSALACLANDGTLPYYIPIGPTILDTTLALTPGQAQYYLCRPQGASYCNAKYTYSAGAPKELAGRDTEIAAGAIKCP